MIIKSLEVVNFRKFREPLRIDSFTDGLNIVVEPNETGKSTLLEALRAAFFIRHSAKTELVRSFVPIGDDVAPKVAVEFDLKGQTWALEKQFMRSPFVRLSGAAGRRESDAAEEALQELLGFERGNNRGSDPEARGPLGMLWVEQASALSVESPNRIVRDTVRGVLESEVGAVTGGRRFDAIRVRVEAAYAELRTPRTGQSRNALAAAEARVTAAATARQQTESVLRDYEQALSDLDIAKARLRIVERDLVDPEVLEERKKLETDQKVAESAALRSAAAEAQYGHAEEVAKTAASRMDRLVAAEARVAGLEGQWAERKAAHDEAKAASDRVSEQERALRAVLSVARTEREKREAVLSVAREQSDVFARAAGARRAVEARKALCELEERESHLVKDAEAAIEGKVLDELAQLERAAIEARARFELGTVKVDIDLAEGVMLRVNGVSSDGTSVDVLSDTRFEIGDLGGLIVRPPQGASRSLEADLISAEQALAAALRSLELDAFSAGVVRNERAAAASRELTTLRTQIAAACPGDPTIALQPGADALRMYVASLGDAFIEIPLPTDDIRALEREVAEAKVIEVSAVGGHEDARVVLSTAESALARAIAELDSSTREHDAAVESLGNILIDGSREALNAATAAAQREQTIKLDALETARAGARAFDVAAIRRRIDNLDRAANRGSEERLELTGKISALEATVKREGTMGPAGQVAEAKEEELTAIINCDRLRREADALEMLRSTLTKASDDASRTFLAPVTKRAARYVQELLPGCELVFDEDLGLAAVKRTGVDENCGDLSRGTQEQLSVLTRLAFADLLLEDGAPISLILDDPLVYSDDVRLETMTGILEEASKRMQVILLTCRSKAFRHVDANRIILK